MNAMNKDTSFVYNDLFNKEHTSKLIDEELNNFSDEESGGNFDDGGNFDESFHEDESDDNNNDLELFLADFLVKGLDVVGIIATKKFAGTGISLDENVKGQLIVPVSKIIGKLMPKASSRITPTQEILLILGIFYGTNIASTKRANKESNTESYKDNTPPFNVKKDVRDNGEDNEPNFIEFEEF